MNYINQPIKINFSDFWTKDPSFYKEFVVYKILSKYFKFELSDRPDLLFFSCYGNKHYNYGCHKVQYIGEPEHPQFWNTDFAISFDYIDDPRHLRLPNYVAYFTPEYSLERLLQKRSVDELRKIKKPNFCCFVVTNPICKERNDFFHQLSQYKKVDSGGGYLNNVGKPVHDKYAFVNNYKFIISFENTSQPGYTTEKVVQGKQTDTIPIYWGNPIISREMNEKSFISFNDYPSFDKLMQRVIEVDNNEDLYLQYLLEPLFYNHKPNEYFEEERLVLFFENVIRSLDKPSVSSKNLQFKLHKTKLQASKAIYGFGRSLYHKVVKP